MNCIFCSGQRPAGELLYEDDIARVVAHDDWAVAGHLMIVAKRHVENASSLALEDWLRFAALWHRAETALLDLTGRERSIAMKLGIQTPHLHVHLYPFAESATRADVFDAIDGRSAVEPDAALIDALRARLV